MTWKQVLWGLVLGAIGAWLWGVIKRRATAPTTNAAAKEPGVVGEVRTKLAYLMGGGGGNGLPDISGADGNTKGACSCARC